MSESYFHMHLLNPLTGFDKTYVQHFCYTSTSTCKFN